MAFERVSTEAILKGMIRKEFAWNIVSDYSRYPVIMENVDEVRIHERSGNEGKSEWFITVEEAPLTWLERDFFDEENYEVRFESIDGDFENINGRWKVDNLVGEDGIRIEFHIDYNLGIPVIEEVLGHILKEKMKTNIDSMLHAIKEELTRTQVDERKYKRHTVRKYNDIVLNGTPTRTFIVNISQKGMLFYYEGEFDSLDVTVQIGDIKIGAVELFNDLKHRNARIIFNEPLSTDAIDEVLERLTTTNIRLHERKLIEREVTLKSGNAEQRIQLINISPGGMLFKYDEAFVALSDAVELCSEVLQVKNIQHDVPSGLVRVAFQKPMEKETYDSMVAVLLSA